MPGEFLAFRYGAGLDLDEAPVRAVGIDARRSGIGKLKPKMLCRQVLPDLARDPERLAGQAVLVDGDLLCRFQDRRDLLERRHAQNIFSFTDCTSSFT